MAKCCNFGPPRRGVPPSWFRRRLSICPLIPQSAPWTDFGRIQWTGVCSLLAWPTTVIGCATDIAGAPNVTPGERSIDKWLTRYNFSDERRAEDPARRVASGRKDKKWLSSCPIYPGHSRDTPVEILVLSTDSGPYFTENFRQRRNRNHSFGLAAKSGVKRARSRFVLIGARPRKSSLPFRRHRIPDPLIIKGVGGKYREKGNHIITQAIEPQSCARHLKRRESTGYESPLCLVQRDGRGTRKNCVKRLREKRFCITIINAQQ